GAGVRLPGATRGRRAAARLMGDSAAGVAAGIAAGTEPRAGVVLEVGAGATGRAVGAGASNAGGASSSSMRSRLLISPGRKMETTGL
nr:hypothetical protein [Tanacetum cinerariifolium]